MSPALPPGRRRLPELRALPAGDPPMHLDLAGMFVAGLLTFASPCVLPLVPLYLGLLGGASVVELRGGPPAHLLGRTAAFALGLATVFAALGLTATALGHLLGEHRRAVLLVSGAAMVAFGLRFLGVLRLRLADREARPWLHRIERPRSFIGAALFGAAFALGWTPCIGPVLGSALTYSAATGASPIRSVVLLGTYAAGLVLPLLAAAAFAPVVLRFLDRARGHLPAVEVATGLAMVMVGAFLATDRLALLTPAMGRSSEACATEGSARACELPVGDGPAPISLAASLVPGPAVVEVMSHHCPVCLRMEPVVAEAERGCAMRVRRGFVEDPAGAALAVRHAIRGVPTFLLLDARGAEIGRLVGEQTVEEVRAALRRVSPEVCAASSHPGAQTAN